MGQKTVTVIRVAVALCWLLSLGACAQKKVPISSGAAAGGVVAGQAQHQGRAGTIGEHDWRKLGIHSAEEQQRFARQAEKFQNEDIHFDFDSYLLSDEAKRILDEKIVFLRRYPGVLVTIEGHCDERGTTEYNLALGERRAKSVWQYLVNSGIDPARLTTISYGEEKPVAFGHDEASWAKNRRVHFVLEY